MIAPRMGELGVAGFKMNDCAGNPGELAPASLLADIDQLVSAYYDKVPSVDYADQRISFGTSGHRGTALSTSFNEAHILAITQAICDYRRHARIQGPLFLGKDTHALSEPAFVTTIEVLAANSVETLIDDARCYTPTPVISHAVLRYNRERSIGLSDGIVISPSHNPPEDGGYKYNSTDGGPAPIEVTRWIEERANDLLGAKLSDVARIPSRRAFKMDCVRGYGYIEPYVADLENVIDMDAIRNAGIRVGVDPLGGAAIDYWQAVIDKYGIDLTVVNDTVDSRFSFVPLDWDGKIRMDCSSPDAMARLIELRDRFDVAFANDPDADRHGIVCPTGGLMNPNRYLAAAVSYLCTHRPGWRNDSAIGKTLVSSGMLDRIAQRCGRRIVEVPVGFKWFSGGLLDSSMAFGGEESAGASFLRRDGTVWTTDKDGIILGLLAAELTARTKLDPDQYYRVATKDVGASFYARIDAPASSEQKAILANLDPASFGAAELAGDTVEAIMNRAPGNGEAVGGIKVMTDHGWFAARPSGTENVYKIYAESFRSREHLDWIQRDAKALIARRFDAG